MSSNLPIPRRTLLSGLAKAVAKMFGYRSYDLTLFRNLKRPEWIYRDYAALPKLTEKFSQNKNPDEADLELCHRLIAAFRSGVEEQKNPDASAIWSTIINREWTDILNAVQASDAAKLAILLNSMFTMPFLNGISTGSLAKKSTRHARNRIWRARCLDDLVSLAESLGVIRTHCPEQGDTIFALRQGAEPLVDAIEVKLQINVGFPEIGGAYGFDIKGRLITPESLEHIYAAFRASNAANICFSDGSKLKVVEIGAGYGGTAYWFTKLNRFDIEAYTIIDLPTTNILQGYFLAKAFGVENVRLQGETDLGQKFCICPSTTYAKTVTTDFDLFINENSMPEMPENVVLDYLDWARLRTKGGVFFSYNQEAYSPFHTFVQPLVPELVRKFPEYNMKFRNASWLRRGYVEETYTIAEF